MHIVILDDDPTIAKGIFTIICRMEKPYVETVSWFYKAEDALEHLKTHPVNLILTDIQMPELNGLSFIDRVKMEWPDIFFIVVSGFDKFDYVNSAYQKGILEYLRKPISRDKLSALLDKVHQNLTASTLHHTEAVLSRLLETDETGYQDFLQRNPEWFKNFFPPGCHFIAALQGLQPSQAQELAGALQTALPFPVCILQIRTSPLYICLVTVESPENAAAFEAAFANRYPGVGGAVSRLSTDCTAIRSLYLEAVQAVKYRMFYPASTLIHGSDVSADRLTTYPDLLEVCHALVKYYTSHQYNKLTEQVRLLFSRDNLQKYSVYAIEQLYYTVLNSLAVLYQKHSMPIPETLPLSSYRCPEDLARHILSLFQEMPQEENSDFRADMQKKVSLYLEQHYMENLTLAMVSNHFSVSYNYFSKLFHDMFSTGYSEYLSHIRMEHARDLLLHSNLNISEISKKVGYSNPKHFSRMFKSAFGQSPADFRKV